MQLSSVKCAAVPTPSSGTLDSYRVPERLFVSPEGFAPNAGWIASRSKVSLLPAVLARAWILSAYSGPSSLLSEWADLL